MKIRNFRCVLCKTEYDPEEVQYTCSKCGTLGILEVNYDYRSFTEASYLDISPDIKQGMWKYTNFLPIDNFKNIAPLKVGGTPLCINKALA
ncbi:unnamed protein product, partial [marine sediment metagenome]